MTLRQAGSGLRKVSAPKALRKTRDSSSVDRLYLECRDRAMRYEFPPGARINEQALGREFGVSRAPLREALNRLAAEGWLDFELNRGFFRKAVSVEEILDLFQVRTALERLGVQLAVSQATDEQIQELKRYWSGIGPHFAAMSSADILLNDEEFHRRLIMLGGNRELSTMLEGVARRIHVARHVDIAQTERNAQSMAQHEHIIELLGQRDSEGLARELEAHLDMSLQRAIEITRDMTARLFVVGIAPLE